MTDISSVSRGRPDELEDVELEGARVLLGDKSGRYPDANAVIVRGSEETILLDAPLGVRQRALQGRLAPTDRIVLSHCHEDHIPGLPLFPDAPVALHEIEVPAMNDFETFLDFFGAQGENRKRLRQLSLERFFYQPREAVEAFTDEATWSLGGSTRITALHTPGHTPGHSCFLVEPVGLLFLADIDLSGFGPLYSDAHASVDDFERSIARVREIDCAYYLSGHHVGLIEGREAYLERLERYSRRIEEREQALLEFLAEPRTMTDIVTHRFVYRPKDTGGGIDSVERKSMQLHLDRLIPAGAVAVSEDHDGTRRYRRT